VDSTRHNNYRPDIDGLRGIAVLLVVAFHLQTPLSHGGFIGVDIFFVISGYLITSILNKAYNRGDYSLTPFYVRRVRRLAPALFVVLTAASVAAWFLLWPRELVTYAQSLVNAVFSASNFWFWSHSGYFDAQTSSLPLLHTWSLAVEEQFYLCFPLFFAILHRRFHPRLVPILAMLALTSFALSARTAFTNPGFAFYWPLSRAWELLVGSLLALRGLPGLAHPLRRNAAAFLGLALIAFAALGPSPLSPASPHSRPASEPPS
jgi:peptidoglycan/LPS O-acetylase OafA/YrhL